MNGCEIKKCTDYRDGVCHYEGGCKYRDEQPAVSTSSPATGSVLDDCRPLDEIDLEALGTANALVCAKILIRDLMKASQSYLKRKKMTARHDCKELNRVWADCDCFLREQNVPCDLPCAKG